MVESILKEKGISLEKGFHNRESYFYARIAEGKCDLLPEIVKQAIDEGLHRGLFTAAMIESASDYLRSFERESA